MGQGSTGGQGRAGAGTRPDSTDGTDGQASDRRAALAERIRASDLFDADWYLARYGTLDTQPETDPAMHYLIYGGLMERDPGPEFSSRFYLDTHPGLRDRGVNPLIHALNHQSPDGKLHRGDPRQVLAAAQRLIDAGRPDMAERLARHALPAAQKYSLAILRANIALTKGDRAAWLDHLNAYLRQFRLMPIRLDSGSSARTPLLDQLTTAPPAAMAEGPRISVLMSAYNVATTVEAAVRSVLRQSWRNLELIVTDDCSTDATATILAGLAARDDRIRLRRNPVNTGPYVARNIALGLATGDYITCQDADDWSHPQRLERHMRSVLKSQVPVSSTGMLRMTPEGRLSQIRPIGGDCRDGALQHSPSSTLFSGDFLRDRLGSWDCARFGADTEMMARAGFVLGRKPPRLMQLGQLALDREGSLTNNPDFGIHPDHGVTPGRLAYRTAWKGWHRSGLTQETVRRAFPPGKRPYPLPEVARVPDDILAAAIAAAAKS